jgi:protein-S-isoprenylcysteine O-methyltransferase Ste14
MKEYSLQDKKTAINKLKHIARQKTKRLIGAVATSLSAICLFFVVMTQENPRSSLGFTIILIATLLAWLSYYEAVWSKRIIILIGQDDEPVTYEPPESDVG